MYTFPYNTKISIRVETSNSSAFHPIRIEFFVLYGKVSDSSGFFFGKFEPKLSLKAIYAKVEEFAEFINGV
jgi:hypothetical protein